LPRKLALAGKFHHLTRDLIEPSIPP